MLGRCRRTRRCQRTSDRAIVRARASVLICIHTFGHSGLACTHTRRHARTRTPGHACAIQRRPAATERPSRAPQHPVRGRLSACATGQTSRLPSPDAEHYNTYVRMCLCICRTGPMYQKHHSTTPSDPISVKQSADSQRLDTLATRLPQNNKTDNIPPPINYPECLISKKLMSSFDLI